MFAITRIIIFKMRRLLIGDKAFCRIAIQCQWIIHWRDMQFDLPHASQMR